MSDKPAISPVLAFILRRIRALSKAGIPITEIADALGVSVAKVEEVLRGGEG